MEMGLKSWEAEVEVADYQAVRFLLLNAQIIKAPPSMGYL